MAYTPFPDGSDGYEGQLHTTDTRGQVYLNDVLLPGWATVDGDASYRVDVQKANGRDGGALVERGYDPAKFQIDVTIWTPEQWEFWQATERQFWRPPGKLDFNDAKKRAASGASEADVQLTSKAAVSIKSWATDARGITACLVTTISLPKLLASGAIMITLKCVQYVPPPPKTVKAARKAQGVADPNVDQRVSGPATTKNRPPKPSEAAAGPAAPVIPAGGAT